ASATTCTLAGLSNGTAYTVTVKARNLSGYGPASSPAVSFTPAGGTSASVPLAPGKPSSTARGNGTVTLTWLPPSSNGGSPVTDYRLEYSTTGSSNWAGLTQAASTATTRTVNGLTNGTAYYFRVAAVNAVGTGTFSVASDAITPIAVPGQPTNVTTQPGSTLVGLSWSAPTDTGDSAITDYIIQYSTDLSAWTTFPDGTSTALDATVTGLANGTSYAFRVAAVNASGTGPYSANASGKPVSVPEAPSGVVGVAGSGEVSLSWTAPSGNGGSPITDYVVQYSTDGASWTPFDDGPSTLTSARVTGLVNGTAYAFQVAAVNAVGTSVYSTSSSFVTPVSALLAPSAPTLANGTAGELGVSWTAPGDSGGSAITGYTATAEASGQSSQTCSTSGATSCTLTGLVNGVGYSVTVTVTNAAGASATSAPSSAVVDQLPGAPTLTHGNQTNSLGQAELTFTAAAAPGTPVTDHVFQFSMTSDFASTQTFNPATTNLQLTQVVTGLSTDPNGQDYWFKVAASNSFGTGQWSVAYGPIKVSAPSLPRNVSASGYDQNSANLWWDPPEFTGGRTVTRYGIQYSSTGGVGWANADPGSHTEAPTATAPLSGVKRSFGLFPNQQGGIRFKVQAVWSVSSEERIGNFTSVFHCDNSSNTAPHDANDECQLDTGTSAPNGSLQLKN
ncbi:MAG: hypothetical protein RL653_2592, partial [Pseudomonadota bacterium]